MKNILIIKAYRFELHKIQSKLTGKESPRQNNVDRFHEK